MPERSRGDYLQVLTIPPTSSLLLAVSLTDRQLEQVWRAKQRSICAPTLYIVQSPVDAKVGWAAGRLDVVSHEASQGLHV